MRNIKDGARDRSPPFRRPGRVRVVVVVGKGQVRGEQGERGCGGAGWGFVGQTGYYGSWRKRELNQWPGERLIVPRCNGNWEILLREQSLGALIRDSIVAPAGHNHVWGWMETRYLLSRTPSRRIDSWQEQGPTLTSEPPLACNCHRIPLFNHHHYLATIPPPRRPSQFPLTLIIPLASLSPFSSLPFHPSIPFFQPLFCLATSFLLSFICLPLSPSPAVGLCDGTLCRRDGEGGRRGEERKSPILCEFPLLRQGYFREGDGARRETSEAWEDCERSGKTLQPDAATMDTRPRLF